LANVTPDPLDAFGQFVMENLRDTAIGYYDGLAEGHGKAPALQPLQADLQSMSVRERAIVRRSVISVIDDAIHDFLFKLQEQADFGHRIEVRVVGLNIENQGEGLHYEPFGPDGWRARFSRYGEPPETG
jgi:hypothetical protein